MVITFPLEWCECRPPHRAADHRSVGQRTGVRNKQLNPDQNQVSVLVPEPSCGTGGGVWCDTTVLRLKPLKKKRGGISLNLQLNMKAEVQTFKIRKQQ